MVEPAVASSLAALGPALSLLQAERVMLFHGCSSFGASGAAAELEPVLAPRKVTRYEVRGPYPTASVLRDALSRMRDAVPEGAFDVIIAVGGGTVLDTAKAASLLFYEPGDVGPFIRGEVTPSARDHRTPMFLIPTTAGTGAEITPFAVVYIDDIKHSLGHPAMLPHMAFLIPEFTYSLPPHITAYTGCDALAQSIESFWSVRADEGSMAYSREAISMILEALPQVMTSPEDFIARAAMLRGAHLSGLAITTSRTTAPHALSYPLTAFHSIPHGHAVMLTLPHFLPLLAEAERHPLQDGVTAADTLKRLDALLSCLGVSSAEEAQDMLSALMEQLQLPRRLSAFGVTQDALPQIVKHGFNPERMRNFPVVLNADMVQQILQDIL